MSVNQSRSMTAELYEGRCDGMVKKIARNRGGEVDAGTFNARGTLSDNYYSMGDRYSLTEVGETLMHGDEALPR